MKRPHDLTAAIVVAHPDDETLWCGGLILEHPDWNCSVVTLCRASDTDRAPRFRRVMRRLNARGALGDLDDGPRQHPLSLDAVEQTIGQLMFQRHVNLLITHGPRGEYTRHLRHEECCRAVVSLWKDGTIHADELWLFAYEDGLGQYLPRAETNVDQRFALPGRIWREKWCLITQVYGFDIESWEARTTPKVEAFRCFHDPAEAADYVLANEIDS